MELTILKDVRRIGQMSLSTHLEKKSFGEGEKTSNERREISAAGTLVSFSAVSNGAAGLKKGGRGFTGAVW